MMPSAIGLLLMSRSPRHVHFHVGLLVITLSYLKLQTKNNACMFTGV